MREFIWSELSYLDLVEKLNFKVIYSKISDTSKGYYDFIFEHSVHKILWYFGENSMWPFGEKGGVKKETSYNVSLHQIWFTSGP